MKIIPGSKRFLLLAVFYASAAIAGTPAAKTTIPDPQNYNARPDFQTIWEDYLATRKGKPCDIIFIGDSITMNWRWGVGRNVWKKYYADRSLDFGQSWDRTQNALWRLENLDIKDFKPKVAVIMIGTNNDHDTPQDVAAGVKAVADATKAEFEGVKIILVSILPNARATQTMAQADAIIQGFADNQSIFYLDLASSFTPVGQTWKGLGGDRLHPTEQGYIMWADALNPLLDKILGTGATSGNGNVHS